jgi:hypothetical protein
MRKSKATEAVRVAQEIAAIRTALRKYGYHIRKRPKQAAWSIYVTDNHFYLLTYHPAPVSSWVLHPQNDESGHHSLETIIQRVLTKQAASIAGKVS